MTPEERSQLNYLCEKIATVKDAAVFDALVVELLKLLKRKHQRIHPEHPTMPTLVT